MKLHRTVAFNARVEALRCRRIKPGPAVARMRYVHNRPLRYGYIVHCIERRLERQSNAGHLFLRRDL